MTGTLVSLRSKGDEASALARLDAAAIELLAEGRAATLSAARIDAILGRLYAQRAELAAVIDDVEARPTSGDTQIDELNADLSVAASAGLAQINLFIEQSEACALALRGKQALTCA